MIIPRALKFGLLFTTAIILSVAACRPSGPDSPLNSPIVAVIGEDTILLSEFEKALSITTGQLELDQNGKELAALKENLLDQLINERLSIAEADRFQIEISPSELDAAVSKMKGSYTDEEFQLLMAEQKIEKQEWVEQLRKEILIQKVVRLATDRPVEILDEEIVNYFETHKEEFQKGASVRARQIVVPTQEEANEIRELLLGRQDFTEVARSRSISPDSSLGGDLGFFTIEEMPKEFEIVFGLKIGEISPVVKSPYGYHLFEVTEQSPGKTLGLQEASDIIREILIEKKRKQLYTEWIADLKQKKGIKINRSLLLSAEPSNHKDESLL